MGTMIRRRASGQWRRMAQPFAMIVVIISLFGMLPGGLTDVAAQNQQEAEPQPGQQADESAAESTYLEIHLAQCPVGLEATSGQDYFDACHGDAVENVDVHITSVGAADNVDETVTSQREAEDGPGVAKFDGILPGDYKVEVAYPESADASYFAYCSIADGEDEIAVSPTNARDGELTIPEGQAVVCDWYLLPGGDAEGGSTIDLTGHTCETGDFEPGSSPTFEELTDACTTPADGVDFHLVDAATDADTVTTTDSKGEASFSFDPASGARLYADVPLEADEWMFCKVGESDPSQIAFDDEGVWEIAPGERAAQECSWFFAAVPDETPKATTESTDTPTEEATTESRVTPTEEATAEPTEVPSGDGDSTIALTANICPDTGVGIGPNYDPRKLADTCNIPASDVDFHLIDDVTSEETVTNPDASGKASFAFNPDNGARFYADVPLADTEYMACSVGDAETTTVEFDGDGVWDIAPGERVDLNCYWFFETALIETPEPTPAPTVEPTVTPTEVPTAEPAEDAAVEPSANETDDEGGNEVSADQQSGQPGPAEDLGSISVLPTTCPEDFDPEVSGVDYESLATNCSEPLSSVSFNFTAPDGSVDTSVTDGVNPLVYRDLDPGTYALYTGIPLEAATEYLFCSADGGNRYQKDFSSTGVTTFGDLRAEQISCEWFVVQNDLRGEETGASLEVHYAECPAGYTGDNLFDDCHGNGVAGKTVALSDGSNELSNTTVVEQDPGPGIVRFTALGTGEFTLSIASGDEDGTVKAFCNLQPSDEKVEISVDGANGSLAIGENEHVLCDWYFIPDQGRTPTPAPEADRAEIIVTLYSCPASEAGYGGATVGDFSDACTETVNDVPFTLGDPGATPLTANTGASGDGAVRFFELLPGDYTMSPRLPDNLTSSAVFCTINDGDPYQKALGNGATNFLNVDGESIACNWYAVEDRAQAPSGPAGSITIRQRLCEGDSIKDYDAECAPGASGSSFTLTSTDGAITLDGTPNDQGVFVFSKLPNGFYAITQNDGQWCKAVADRVDSKSRVIVANGGNTDVVFYQCGDVKGLPTTGTGPAGTVQGDDQPLLTSTMWAIILGLFAIPFAVIGIFQTRRYRKQVQAPVEDASYGPVVTPSGRVRMRFR